MKPERSQESQERRDSLSFSTLEKPQPKKRRRKNKSSNNVPDDSIQIDENIWKDFPEELFERVLARLPVASFFRLRRVCRSWNATLTSHTFLKLCAEATHYPWFYIPTDGYKHNCAMYDHLLQKWHHFFLPFPKTIITPVASAGGLICFLSLLERNPGLLVCNPLIGSFQELPSPNSAKTRSDTAFAMAFNNNSNSYKLLCLGNNGEYELYDSLEKSWNKPSQIPSHVTLPINNKAKSQTLFHDGVIYFMRTDPDGIVLFDIVKGTWKQMYVPLPQSPMERVLALCNNNVFLLGLLTKNAATCVCVWELQKMTYLWREVDRMPNMMCLEFYGKPVQMSCLGSKGLVFLSLRSRKLNRLVLYDLSKRLWSKVPNCVLHCRRKRQWITSGISFEPSLNASV